MEPDILIPLAYAIKRVVLIGDQKQIGPILQFQGNIDKDLAIKHDSLFSRMC